MKNLNDQFGDEEKQHLNYLGSMLGRRNTPEEEEMEDILDAMEKGKKLTPRTGLRIRHTSLGRTSRPRVFGYRKKA